MKHLPLISILLASLTACAPIRGVSEGVQRHLADRHDKAFQATVDRMAKDTRHSYRLDYTVTDEWLQAVVETLPKFRIMGNGQFDMAPWLQSNGVEANTIASAIYDTDKRTITVIDTGPNAALIEHLIEPLRPVRHTRLKALPPPVTPSSHSNQ